VVTGDDFSLLFDKATLKRRWNTLLLAPLSTGREVLNNLPILVIRALRWPLFGPLGRDVLVLHTTPDSMHKPHFGCCLSHRSLRLRHSSQAEPGCCRDCGGGLPSEVGENIF
jgi:hypothetical protein